MLKNILPIGSAGSYRVPPRESFTPRLTRESPIWRASGTELVKLGDDESVAGPDGGEGLVEAGPVPVGAGESLVEGFALGGEIMQDGRAADYDEVLNG
jgi:hypothetical protein